MNELEQKLKDYIIERYGSLNKFTDVIDMPWTTLDSILKRGVAKSNISNIIKITEELNLDADKLAKGQIIRKYEPETIAAHHEGNEWSEDELKEIEEFKKFVRAKREEK